MMTSHKKGLYNMLRKRVTQVLPFLLPLRQKQKKLFYYMKMYFDYNLYSNHKAKVQLPYRFYETKSLMLNENSGFDMKYQLGKVHNLHLAAKTLDHLVIYPGETFSFWQLVRFADQNQPYKDGLTLMDGKITGAYGGGLCQLSNMLFWMFLHTPLTIVERHGHAVEAFPPTTDELPQGTDATVSEGWLDLKVRNNTKGKYQLEINFDEDYMYGRILTNYASEDSYEVFNQNVFYFKKDDKVYQNAGVWQRVVEAEKDYIKEQLLYNNTCEIGYHLPEQVQVMEYALLN